jgi:hypothetical protein
MDFEGDDSEELLEALLYIQRYAESIDPRRDGTSVHSGWGLFDEVFDTLEQELHRADEDLRRLTAAAAYLRALLPPRRRRPRRWRCAYGHREVWCRRR